MLQYIYPCYPGRGITLASSIWRSRALDRSTRAGGNGGYFSLFYGPSLRARSAAISHIAYSSQQCMTIMAGYAQTLIASNRSRAKFFRSMRACMSSSIVCRSLPLTKTLWWSEVQISLPFIKLTHISALEMSARTGHSNPTACPVHSYHSMPAVPVPLCFVCCLSFSRPILGGLPVWIPTT